MDNPNILTGSEQFGLISSSPLKRLSVFTSMFDNWSEHAEMFLQYEFSTPKWYTAINNPVNIGVKIRTIANLELIFIFLIFATVRAIDMIMMIKYGYLCSMQSSQGFQPNTNSIKYTDINTVRL